MKLPADSVIPPEKLTRYLLLPQARADKAAFLAKAGYTPENYERLLADLRTQVLPLEAVPSLENQFGRYYEIRAALRGPNGVTLQVKTIWMTEHLSSETRFITLLPDKAK